MLALSLSACGDSEEKNGGDASTPEPFLTADISCPEAHTSDVSALIRTDACDSPDFSSPWLCPADTAPPLPIVGLTNPLEDTSDAHIDILNCRVPVHVAHDRMSLEIPERNEWVDTKSAEEEINCSRIQSIEINRTCTFDIDNVPLLTEIPVEAQNCSVVAHDAPSPSCTVGGSESLTFVLTGLHVPDVEAHVGFNLDCYDTSDQDRYGCSKVDGPSGLDNGFAGLAQMLEMAGMNVRKAINDGFVREPLSLSVRVRNYSGSGSDDCVTVDVYDSQMNVVAAATTGIIRAEGDGLRLIVAFNEFALKLPFDNETLDFRLENVRLDLPINANHTVIAGGVLGGIIVWDDGEGGGLAALVPAIVEALGSDGLDAESLAPIIRAMLDIHHPATNADPNDCSALSLGVSVDGVAL